MGLSCFRTFLLLQKLKGESWFNKAIGDQPSAISRRLFSYHPHPGPLPWKERGVGVLTSVNLSVNSLPNQGN
jgi:hypothetical protein